MRCIVLFCGALLSCSSGAQTSPPRAEPPPIPAPPPPAPAPPPPAPAPTATSVAETPPEPPACSGADLDLDAILASTACRVSQKAEPPWSPNELGLEISDKTVQVASGDTITITVAIVNRTKAERALDVDNCGGKAARWSTEVADARGKRVDFIARCGYGTGCGRDTRRITLLPGGRARVTVPFRAITVTENDKCDRSEAPMRPGKFTLRVLTPFRDPDPARGAAASKERFAAAPLDVK